VLLQNDSGLYNSDLTYTLRKSFESDSVGERCA
jgi:hypothetical protein